MPAKYLVKSLTLLVFVLCALGAWAQMPNPMARRSAWKPQRNPPPPPSPRPQKQVDHGRRHRRHQRQSDLYEKMDNTQIASATVAIEKARSAVIYKRPTKAMQH